MSIVGLGSKLRPVRSSRFCRVLWLIPFVGVLRNAAGPIAEYKFEEDGRDSINREQIAELKNTRFANNSLFLNGNYEYGGTRNGYRAVAPINGFSYQSFTVSLDFFPIDFNPSPSNAGPFRVEELLDELTRGRWGIWRGWSRSNHETILIGGASYRWLGFNHRGGHLNLTLNNQTFTHVFTNTVVTPKHWHNIVCSFDLKRRRVVTLLDGKPLDVVELPEHFNLEIIRSNDEASDKLFTFANYSYGSAFHGYAAGLLVFGSALSEQELASLSTNSVARRPIMNLKSNRAIDVVLPVSILLLIVVVAVRINQTVAANKLRSVRTQESSPR